MDKVQHKYQNWYIIFAKTLDKDSENVMSKCGWYTIHKMIKIYIIEINDLNFFIYLF